MSALDSLCTPQTACALLLALFFPAVLYRKSPVFSERLWANTNVRPPVLLTKGALYPDGIIMDFVRDFRIHGVSRFTTEASIREYAEQLTWVHPVQLTPTYTAKGEWQPDRGFHIPNTLQGKSFLDIGAWDGYYTFLAEERRASSVTAVDFCCWGGTETGVPEKPGVTGGSCCWANGTTFQLAHTVRRSQARAIRINVYDLTPEIVGEHDVVLFAGVLYHLRYPFLALTRVASVTRSMLIVETVDNPEIEEQKPLMLFYPGKDLNNDPTNWYSINRRALVSMLEVLGFVRFEEKPTQHGRYVLHAFKP